MDKLIIKAIVIYQTTLAHWQQLLLPSGWPVGCRFYPSCSDYTKQAVKNYGSGRGLILGLKRILRCHPWTAGGTDWP